MPEAMNFTFGDLIVIELALVHYIKELDLSLQSGQYLSELIGKVEYDLNELRTQASKQLVPNV